jgi:AcrR family transcriptional regulator
VSAGRSRLPAAERRASVLDCACRAFSRGSYRATTTAEIAREAGVTEPILYRHFESKRDLYLACLDESWSRVRTLWEGVVVEEPDPASWVAAMGQAFLDSEDHRPVITNLWIEALAEASDDEETRRRFREHLMDVHGFVADVIRRSQAAGGVSPERDPDAEAWMFIANGLLSIVDRRLGGVLDEAWPKIRAARRAWMTARDE